MNNKIMKKIEVCLLVGLCLLFFCACEKQVNNLNPEAENLVYDNASEMVLDNQLVRENNAYDSSESANISVAQAFALVLLNEKKFVCTDSTPYENTNVIIEFSGFLKDSPYGYEEETSIVQFAVVDMDGDTIPEVILEIEEYYGYIILHYRDGEIYGNVVGYRSMGGLNAEGAFESSSGASDNGLHKLYYLENSIVYNEAMRMADVDVYYSYDIRSNRDTWDKVNDLFHKSHKADWHMFTDEEINMYIVQNPIFNSSSEMNENLIERQKYLDSLNYLINLTYDLWRKSEHVYKQDAKDYYEGCLYEMNKIYQLCQDKLPQEELLVLQEEQEKWLENYDQRLNEELEIYEMYSFEDLLEHENRYRYYSYGDMILRRTFELINIYYDFGFYDSIV